MEPVKGHDSRITTDRESLSRKRTIGRAPAERGEGMPPSVPVGQASRLSTGKMPVPSGGGQGGEPGNEKDGDFQLNGLTPSRQCYLVEIMALEAEQGRARPSEIAARIGVNRPSVTAALRNLAKRSFIRYEPYGNVVLTPKGRQVAEEIMVRRGIIRDYLVMCLDMEEAAAVDAACRMQHSVPDAVVDLFFTRLVNPGYTITQGDNSDGRHAE